MRVAPGFVRVGRRMRIVNPVGEQEHIRRLVALELAQHTSREATAVRVQRLRSVQAYAVRVVRRYVRLPAAKDDGVSLAHQEAVARMQWGARVHGTRGELLNPRIVLRPRLTTSKIMLPLPRSGSAGWSISKSAEK